MSYSKHAKALVVIDPQNDFMDLARSALPVPGARDDMKRLAHNIRANPYEYQAIYVSVDTHQKRDIAHPAYWENRQGEQPQGMVTSISAMDVGELVWVPMDGKYDQAVKYLSQLEQKGAYPHTIWNQHCIKGSWGWQVYKPLQSTLDEWEQVTGNQVCYVEKGYNPDCEHFGLFAAEVPNDDPRTQFNIDLAERLKMYREVHFAGEALSHCVKASVQQYLDYIDETDRSKVVLLRDCTSSIPAIEGVADFPAIAAEWIHSASVQGMQVRNIAT